MRDSVADPVLEGKPTAAERVELFSMKLPDGPGTFRFRLRWAIV